MIQRSARSGMDIGVVPERKSLTERVAWNLGKEAKSEKTTRVHPKQDTGPRGLGEGNPRMTIGASTQQRKPKSVC